MKKLNRFFGVCALVLALVVVAGPAQAGHPLAIWTGSADLGGYVVLMDFDSSVFTLADVAKFEDMLRSNSGSTGGVTDFVYIYGPGFLGVGSAATWNNWLLTNYQSALGTDAYIYLKIGQSVNQFGTNYDVMTFLALAASGGMPSTFILGLQIPVVLADPLLGLTDLWDPALPWSG